MLIQVLNSPESCCGLKEKTVLKIALDVGEKFLKLRVILKSLLITWSMVILTMLLVSFEVRRG